MADMPSTDILGVAFKRGQSRNLPTTNIKDGTFYLTTDTHRLYIGQTINSKTELVELNKSITIVDNLSDLPNYNNSAALANYVGQFYYVQNNNVLCVVRKEVNSSDNTTIYKWVQINPDTVLSGSTDNTTVAVNKKIATITSTVADSKGNQSIGKHTVEGGNNITITKTTDGYKIDSTDTNTTYSLTTNTTTEADKTAKIVLNSSNPTGVDEVQITTTDDDYSELTATADKNNKKINFDLKVNNMYNTGFSSGHGTSDTDTTNGFKFTVTDGAGSKSASIDPVITYGSGTTESAHFLNGTATLDVYTKTQTDNAIGAALQTADAMTFKGVLALKTEGTTEHPEYKVVLQGTETYVTSANAGDTYKVGAEGTYFNHSCRIGDLLIAKEDNLNSSTILEQNNWYYIPSGDDEIINTAVSGDDTFQITSTVRDVIGAHTLKLPTSSTGDILISKDSKSSNTELIQTIDHKTYNSPEDNTPSNQSPIQAALNTPKNFTAITGIQTSNGHITGYTTQTLNTNIIYKINSVDHNITNFTNQQMSIGPVITDTNGATIPLTRLNIQTDTLKFKQETQNEVRINLVWESFDN